MRVLDLFAGIGGFSLAAHWMGWETSAFVEKEPFCQKILRKNFGQEIEIHDDIFTFSGKSFRGRIDIVTGGFPCQPFSAAGKRKGRNDERHLFPEMLRVIREVQPRWVVAENVRGLLSIESGRVFAEVVSSLEGEGFEVVTFCVPASAVEAPHRRDRLWIVAHAVESRSCFGRAEDHQEMAGRNCKRKTTELIRTEAAKPNLDDAYAERDGRDRPDLSIPAIKQQDEDRIVTARLCDVVSDANSRNGYGRCGTVQMGRVGGSSQAAKNGFGAGTQWSIEPAVGRVAHGVSDRVHRLKALGNSIVPQLAFEIFKAIEAAEEER